MIVDAFVGRKERENSARARSDKTQYDGRRLTKRINIIEALVGHKAREPSSARSQTPTLHLHQKLCLDPPRRLGFVLASGAAKGVHLIDEDDGRLVLSRHLE